MVWGPEEREEHLCFCGSTPPEFGGKAFQHFPGNMAEGQLSATANRVEDRKVETRAKYSS